MIARLVPLLLLVLFVWLGGSPSSAGLEILNVEIQLPRLSQPLRLAPADADAFQRRLARPPPYVGPLPSGDSYVVTSAYWDAALRADETAPRVDAEAAYFPDGGIVRARQANRDLFFVLDQRQRVMLDRYIRLGSDGAIGPRPGALDVLIAASRGETISIELAGKPLSDAGTRALWRALDEQDASVTFQDPPQPPSRSGGFWITFTTIEGRSLQYFYDPVGRMLTDFLGTESYTITSLPTTTGDALQIEQQPPQGSKLWWPVMIGGGIVLLAAAVWLQRRNT